MAPKQEKVVSLGSLNQSELVLLANWNKLNASRALTREQLLEMLNTLTPNEQPGPFDRERQVLSDWLKRYWSSVRMQVPKKVCPDCFQCRDIQILDCYTANRANLGGSHGR